jgi:beta-lactamase class A
MRGSAVLLAFALALGGLIPGAPAAASTAELVQHLDQLVGSFPGGAGLWISDPNSTAAAPLYSHSADEPIVTASLYKLAVLTEAERRVDTGELHYSDIITIEPEDITDDGSFEVAGTALTLDEALEAMITISDNGAALALWHILGPGNINATLVRIGVKNFHVFLDWNEDNVATPRAVGTLLTMLAKRQLISAAASDRMLARLERQQINDRLPAALPQGVVIAHKTGNLPGLTHDAGIIFTPSGPRVVVAMTWDAGEADAYSFISNVGSIVYSTLLEPPANARYDVPRTTMIVDTASSQRISVPITNVGSTGWLSSGPGAVRLTWEMRDNKDVVVATSPAPITLPALAPGRSADVAIVVPMPKTPGDYKVFLGLVDANGNGLAKLGAATASFQMRAHLPYLMTATTAIPTILHRGEASLLVTTYAALPTAGTTAHALTLAWRLIDTKTNRSVVQGTVPVGSLQPSATGVFFVPYVAPAVIGTYRLSYELRERGVAVNETTIMPVTIVGPRTFPDDDGGRTPPALTITPLIPTPSPTPRIKFPNPSGFAPSPQLPVLPRGRPTPTPGP